MQGNCNYYYASMQGAAGAGPSHHAGCINCAATPQARRLSCLTRSSSLLVFCIPPNGLFLSRLHTAPTLLEHNHTAEFVAARPPLTGRRPGRPAACAAWPARI